MEIKKVSVKSWIFTHIICIIPVVNIIYMLGMVLGISKYKSKVTYFRSLLLLTIILIIIYLLVLIFLYWKNNGSFDFNNFFTELKDKFIEYWNNIVEYYKNLINQFKK